MPNIRELNPIKYQISKHRFIELYHFCLQYNEWMDELKYKTDTLKSIEVTDMPFAVGESDQTAQLACRRATLSDKCRLIEQTAMETDSELYEYILKAVTNENITFPYLYTVMGIPCSRNTYYDRRRKFYWLLDRKRTV